MSPETGCPSAPGAPDGRRASSLLKYSERKKIEILDSLSEFTRVSEDNKVLESRFSTGGVRKSAQFVCHC